MKFLVNSRVNRRRLMLAVVLAFLTIILAPLAANIAFETAVNHDNLKQVKFYLSLGMSPNSGLDYGEGLINAVYKRDSAMVTLLLCAGANPNLVDQGMQETAVSAAQEICDPEIMSLLLAHGGRLSQDDANYGDVQECPALKAVVDQWLAARSGAPLPHDATRQ